jgi:hypothetical protein
VMDSFAGGRARGSLYIGDSEFVQGL